MIQLKAVLMIAGMLMAADDQSADRALIARAAREQAARTQTSSLASDALSQIEAKARSDLALAQARLDLVQARRALKSGQNALAAEKARSALSALATLPGTVDGSVYELQAEGVLARVGRTARPAPTLGQNEEPDAERETQNAYPQDDLDRKARAAAKVARRYDGGPIPEVDTSGNAQALRERALANQLPDKTYGYRPGEEIIDVDAILERDQQRYFYERSLYDTIKAIEARQLTEADEARVVPDGEIAFPNDWPERVAKRAKYADGQIARSKSWVDKDGREWYVAIYDIRDVTYQPPDFHAADELSITRSLRNTLDRDALRHNSYLFRGYAEDLAAGIPLLRYFGGIDDFEYRGPKYSQERRQQVIDMIKRFTEAHTAEAYVGP